MKAKALFVNNADEIDAINERILQGENHLVVPDEEISEGEILFSISDVSRAWRYEGNISIIWIDGMANRIAYDEEVWIAIQNKMWLNDKGYRG